MTYSEVIHFLYEQLPMFSRIGAPAFKKDLTNIKALCNALGNPQEKFQCIHVGGTNGKGSVSHMLAAVFQKSGYKTGLHTSPHLTDFRERIRINGAMTSEAFVVSFVEENRSSIEKIKPSFFEISVAMAFQWFAIHKVDIAIVEVGLGGRLDSTNILNPVLSVITNISLEHTQILGDTRAEIAVEKAGIIKDKTPVVIGETHAETEAVFIQKANACDAAIDFADQKYLAESISTSLEGQEIKVKGNHQEQCLKLDLGGRYQLKNVQTVFSAIDKLKENGWVLTDDNIKKALAAVKSLTGLRGRWDILSVKPAIVADTSHNKAGISEVLRQIKTIPYKKIFIIVGFVKDKNVREILKLFPKEASYYFCHADNPRKLDANELKVIALENGLQGTACQTVGEAVCEAKEKATGEDVILITGSTFIVAEALI